MSSWGVSVVRRVSCCAQCQCYHGQWNRGTSVLLGLLVEIGASDPCPRLLASQKTRIQAQPPASQGASASDKVRGQSDCAGDDARVLCRDSGSDGPLAPLDVSNQ